jgi:hypothetical protein
MHKHTDAVEKTIADLNEQLYRAYARIVELQDKIKELENEKK